MLLVEGGCPEQRGDEDNEVDAQEGELSPEENDSEEGEIDCDTVDKGAENRGCADLLGRGIGSKFAAGLDEVLVLGAVRLLVKAIGLHVAVGLWAPSGVLRSNDHGDGVVDGENN